MSTVAASNPLLRNIFILLNRRNSSEKRPLLLPRKTELPISAITTASALESNFCAERSKTAGAILPNRAVDLFCPYTSDCPRNRQHRIHRTKGIFFICFIRIAYFLLLLQDDLFASSQRSYFFTTLSFLLQDDLFAFLFHDEGVEIPQAAVIISRKIGLIQFQPRPQLDRCPIVGHQVLKTAFAPVQNHPGRLRKFIRGIALGHFHIENISMIQRMGHFDRIFSFEG